MSSSSPNVTWHRGELDPSARATLTGGTGGTVWFTGLSGSGKSTVAVAVERMLAERGRLTYILDGDNLRHGLNGDLGFSAEDRAENIRRVSEVARLFADAGLIALVPVISPYVADRERARRIHEETGLAFVEVYVCTSLEVCEGRDPKGLYAKARAGELKGFTGIDDPYEAPEKPELLLDTGSLSVDEAASEIIAALSERGLV